MQTTDRVILVRPTGFAHDPETATTNAFQRLAHDPHARRAAETEFDELLMTLDRAGVGTTVLDPKDPHAPNAVFPNNWFSTHADGSLVLYPMLTPGRRRERDPAFADVLRREGFKVERVIDLSPLEGDNRALEGTGSLVLDRERDLAFAALSPRTSERALALWCALTGGAPVPFLATMDGTLAGAAIYHTNVVMSIGSDFAMVCTDAMPYPADREDVVLELERSAKAVIRFNLEQLHQYVGNVLELRGKQGPVLLLSTTAFRALDPAQRRALDTHVELLPVDVPTIERLGGGSVRCMLAELFLPRA